MYISTLSLTNLAKRAQYAFTAPQPIPVFAEHGGHSDGPSCDVLSQRMRRIRRQSRRQINVKNVKSSWY